MARSKLLTKISSGQFKRPRSGQAKLVKFASATALAVGIYKEYEQARKEVEAGKVSTLGELRRAFAR